MSEKPTKTNARKHGPTTETKAKYGAAERLYAATTLSCRAICALCGVSLGGFTSYLHHHRRDLLLARYGIDAGNTDAAAVRLREAFGQSPSAYRKYRQAVEACRDSSCLEYNISQIARKFRLDGTALANQLRAHFPDIPVLREIERWRRGLNDNQPCGVRPQSVVKYAEAVELLRTGSITVRQAAQVCGVSYSGLRQHVLFYHKDLVVQRRASRKSSPQAGRPGTPRRSGGIHAPSASAVEKYRRAVELYRTTALTAAQIAKSTNVSESGLRHHLRTWHRNLMLERRGGTVPDTADCIDLSSQKRYLKSTAEKYAPAIERLRAGGMPTAAAAAEFGLHPETFREYLYEHEPELAALLGKTKLDNGKTVLRRSAEKYAEAVRLYETTTEPLKSIARKLGLQYNSVGGFVRRSRPDAIKSHNRLLEQQNRRLRDEENERREKERAEAASAVMEKEAGMKERIIEALKQTGNHRTNAAKLLGIGKSTLYNRMKSFGLI